MLPYEMESQGAGLMNGENHRATPFGESGEGLEELESGERIQSRRWLVQYQYSWQSNEHASNRQPE